MIFIDKAQILVQSGRGGAGCISFKRERFIPKGGPDGGRGGSGGNVILRASSQKQTLRHLKFGGYFRASNGMGGQGSKKTGRAGESLVVEVPLGTVVSNSDTGSVLGDLSTDGAFVVVAEGGKGGKGNVSFKSSTNRAPRYSESGKLGFSISLDLEVKSLTDVGIVGFPNVGKSTLLSVISATKPKIGDYPFTTISPNFGVLDFGIKVFTIVDIPGLVEGSHNGAGLGSGFLRHLERASIIVYLVDASKIDLGDPLASVRILNRELGSYNRYLLDKPNIFVLSKIDISSGQAAVELFKHDYDLRKYNFSCISARTGEGIHDLISRLYKELNSL